MGAIVLTLIVISILMIVGYFQHRAKKKCKNCVDGKCVCVDKTQKDCGDSCNCGERHV